MNNNLEQGKLVKPTVKNQFEKILPNLKVFYNLPTKSSKAKIKSKASMIKASQSRRLDNSPSEDYLGVSL